MFSSVDFFEKVRSSREIVKDASRSREETGREGEERVNWVRTRIWGRSSFTEEWATSGGSRKESSVEPGLSEFTDRMSSLDVLVLFLKCELKSLSTAPTLVRIELKTYKPLSS